MDYLVVMVRLPYGGVDTNSPNEITWKQIQAVGVNVWEEKVLYFSGY
jgi:hypothetical protein